MTTPADLATYTTAVLRARTAYTADQAVAAGYCANLDGRRKHSGSRVCWACLRRVT